MSNSRIRNIKDYLTGPGADILPAIGILLFVLFIFTQRWFELYLQVRAYQVLVVGLSLMLILPAVSRRSKIKNQLAVMDLLWFIAIAVIIIYIFLAGFSDYLSDLFYFTAGLAFLVLAKVRMETYGKAFALVKYAGLVYAAGSVAQYFFTETFNRFIFNFTTDYSQESIARLTERNYFPGFGFGRTPVAPGHITMAFGLIVLTWDKCKSKVLQYGDLLICLFLLFALIITGKRSILLWFIVALPITYIALGQGKEVWLRALKMIAALIFGFALLILVLYLIDPPPFITRLYNLLRDVVTGGYPSSVDVRFRLYQFAWPLFLENPLFGIGWHQFRELAPADHHVHNVYLQLLTEMGSFGFLVVMTPLIYCFGATWRALKRLLGQSEAELVMWKKGLTYSIYYQSFFLLYSLSDNPFYELIFTLFYFVAISITGSFLVFEKEQLKGKLLCRRKQVR